MQKFILAVVTLMLTGNHTQAQSLAVNTTGAPADVSAMLDITSTTKGLLIPRMTSAQRTAIAAPAEGLQVYQTDATVGLYIYRSGAWTILNTGTGWSITGNTGTSGSNFMGSTDNVDVAFRTNNTEVFRMTNNQRVGIGVAGPSQKLHVSDVTTPNAATIRVSGLANTSTLALGTAPFTTVMVDANGVMYRGGTTGSPTTAWYTLGNAGTAVATNFIGTTDNVDFAFRTNNTEAMRLSTNQRLGIGFTTAPTAKLEVNSAAGDAVYGHSNNIGGYLGYETNITAGTAGTLLGAGVYASNALAGYTSVYAASSGAATVAANINYSSAWIASHSVVDNASATFSPSASYNQLNVTNSTLANQQIALRGWSERGTTASNPSFTIGVQGVANAQNQDAIGMEGLSYSSSGGVSTGGYFEGLTYPGISIAYAYVGGWINGATARKIVGTGSVSEIIPTARHGRVTLTAPESPEYWYQDYGSVKLVNGKAHVELDPILADIIFVNDENPIRVFCTPVDMPMFNGVCIINKTSHGFDIVEINNGNHSGTIDYQVIVKPKTNYGEGRFPQAPGPSYLKKDKEPALAKAANNPADGRTIYRWPSETETYNYKPEDMVGVGEEVKAGQYRGMIKMADGTFKPANPVDKRSITSEKDK